jgi:glycosyltransferase involved in cell wall biosynthesis
MRGVGRVCGGTLPNSNGTVRIRVGKIDTVEIAVILPCLNEEAVIGAVVKDFQKVLPDATVYVYDNDSTDDTARVAREAGAEVRVEPRRGKGNVVRRALADIEADVYLLADGDGTYEAEAAPRMIESLFENNVDMVVGVREGGGAEAYRSGHRFGNRLFNALVRWLFGSTFTDILTGYRVMSRRFVKSFPSSSREFEIETEISIHALAMGAAVLETRTRYRERAAGAESKLRTFRDGFRILGRIIQLVRLYRPLFAYGLLATGLALVSLILGVPIVIEYAQTGLVPRFPTAILAAALMSIAAVALAVGFVLASLSKQHAELKRLAYLRYPGPA